MKTPNTPFSTCLSGSVKDTELCIRNIFQWKKKRRPIVLFILTAVLVLFCCGLVSCRVEAEEPVDETLETTVTPPPEETEQATAGIDVDETLTLTTADGRILTVKLHLMATEQDKDWFAVTRVEVWDADTLIQTIDPAQLPDSDFYLFEGLFVLRGYNIGSPDVRDLNFDGSEDLGLLATNHLPHNVPYRYFLWDEEQGQLVDSFMMSNLPDLDTEKQQLIEKWTDALTRYYKLENNIPVLIRQIQWEGEKSETSIYEDKLTGLTLDDNGTGDDYVTITARLPANDSAQDEITMYVVLGGGQGLLKYTWETHAWPKLLSGRISSVQKDSIVVELRYPHSNYDAAGVFIVEVQNKELTLFEYNEPLNENNVIYGSKVVPRTDSELSCVRIPTLASKWHSPEWNTLTWENEQWKNVPDGYFTDTYTLTVDGGLELTLALRGRNDGDYYCYYDQIQILHEETVHQSITENSFVHDDHCLFEYFNADAPYHRVLVYDINFDGYTDFGLPCNTTHNDGHVWFLYDPHTRQYNFAFSLAGQPTVNEDAQQIIEEWWIDTVSDSYITSNTYEYKQGELTLIESRKAADGDDARSAYRNALEELIHDRVFPDGNRPGLTGDMAENLFAVLDVDGDGREELILLYTTTFTAGHAGYVFDYDETTQTMRTQFLEYPILTFYENGAVKAGLSHNQGWAGRFWPYYLYQYQPSTDSYQLVGMVNAWDKSISEANPSFPPFPSEIDSSGTGFVYYIYIMGDGEYDNSNPVDASVYYAWLENYIGDASEVEIPYLALTEENIQLLRSKP